MPTSQSLHHLLDSPIILVYFICPSPLAAPSGPDPLIKRQTDGIHLTNWTVEVGFEITVCSQALLDMSNLPIFSVKLHGLEVRDILRVEEHITNSNCALVYLDWVTCKQDAFGDDACRRRRKQRPSGNQS